MDLKKLPLRSIVVLHCYSSSLWGAGCSWAFIVWRGFQDTFPRSPQTLVFLPRPKFVTSPPFKRQCNFWIPLKITHCYCIKTDSNKAYLNVCLHSAVVFAFYGKHFKIILVSGIHFPPWTANTEFLIASPGFCVLLWNLEWFHHCWGTVNNHSLCS